MLAASAIQNLEAEKKNTHTKISQNVSSLGHSEFRSRKKTHTHIKSKIRQTSLKAGAKTRVTNNESVKFEN